MRRAVPRPVLAAQAQVTCLWVPASDAGGATAHPQPVDPHSGLPRALQLDFLRRTHAARVDSMPMPDWGVHRDHGVLKAVDEKLRHANPPIATKLQTWIVILVDIATFTTTHRRS